MNGQHRQLVFLSGENECSVIELLGSAFYILQKVICSKVRSFEKGALLNVYTLQSLGNQWIDVE